MDFVGAHAINIFKLLIQLNSLIGVMVTRNNLDMTIQLAQTLKTMLVVIEHYVAQVVHNIIGINYRVPIRNYCGIVLLDRSEATGREKKLSVMSEVSVTGNEDSTHTFTSFVTPSASTT
jgi:hypothetical protein